MNSNPTIRSYFRLMNVVYSAQVVVLLILATVAAFIEHTAQADEEFTNIIQYALIILIVGGLGTSQFIPRLIISKIDRNLELTSKLQKYFPVVMVRSALLEVPGLFSCVAVFVTGKVHYLVIVPLLLLVFYFYRPTKNRLAEDLSLSVGERKLLNDPGNGDLRNK